MKSSPSLILPKSPTSKINRQKINTSSYVISPKATSQSISNITKSTKVPPTSSNNRQILQVMKDQNRNLKQQNEFLLKMLREFNQKQERFKQKQHFFQEIIQQIKYSNIMIEKQIMNKRIQAEKQITKAQEKLDQLSQVDINNNNGRSKKVTGTQLQQAKPKFSSLDKYSDGMSTDAHEMLSPKSIGTINKLWALRQKYQ